MKKLVVLLVLFSALSFSAATASATPTQAVSASVCNSGHISFAKTKFAFHMGLAFGVFHHFIWKPYKAGAFTKGTPGRTKTLVKAGAAAVFIYHELHLACRDANSSKLLKPLLVPMNFVLTTFQGLETKLRSGSVSPTDLNSVGSAVTSLGAKSSGLGVPIIESITGFGG